jgi:hypothetical protein
VRRLEREGKIPLGWGTAMTMGALSFLGISLSTIPDTHFPAPLDVIFGGSHHAALANAEANQDPSS